MERLSGFRYKYYVSDFMFPFFVPVFLKTIRHTPPEQKNKQTKQHHTYIVLGLIDSLKDFWTLFNCCFL